MLGQRSRHDTPHKEARAPIRQAARLHNPQRHRRMKRHRPAMKMRSLRTCHQLMDREEITHLHQSLRDNLGFLKKRVDEGMEFDLLGRDRWNPLTLIVQGLMNYAGSLIGLRKFIPIGAYSYT
jgi:hypothetical protein